MANLQVRAIDNGLYKALGKRAEMDNRSISQEVVMIIKEYLKKPASSGRSATDAFLELAGTWEDSRSADEIIKSIRKSRTAKSKRFKVGF